jgi:hypothetical protein
MSMGNWKIKQTSKKSKASRTRSSKAKLYIAVPPAEGWPAFTGSYSVFGVRNARK